MRQCMIDRFATNLYSYSTCAYAHASLTALTVHSQRWSMLAQPASYVQPKRAAVATTGYVRTPVLQVTNISCRWSTATWTTREKTIDWRMSQCCGECCWTSWSVWPACCCVDFSVVLLKEVFWILSRWVSQWLSSSKRKSSDDPSSNVPSFLPVLVLTLWFSLMPWFLLTFLDSFFHSLISSLILHALCAQHSEASKK